MSSSGQDFCELKLNCLEKIFYDSQSQWTNEVNAYFKSTAFTAS
jgi:hypothetical protein